MAAPGVVAILLSFYGTLLRALIIALLFAPMQHWLQRRLGGRPTLAALVTLDAVVLIVVLPVGLMNELARLHSEVQSGEVKPQTWLHQMFDSLPRGVAGVHERFGMVDVHVLKRRLVDLLNQAGQFIAAGLLRFGRNTFELVASLFIMLYVALIRLCDGAALMTTLRESVLLTPLHQRQLTRKFSTVIRVAVEGNLLVVLLQDLLGGLAFWVLDVRGALVQAVLMASLSLLPAVGAALVWGPVALYLLATGALGAALGLSAWGVMVIGRVDHLLRPLLVGKDT